MSISEEEINLCREKYDDQAYYLHLNPQEYLRHLQTMMNYLTRDFNVILKWSSPVEMDPRDDSDWTYKGDEPDCFISKIYQTSQYLAPDLESHQAILENQIPELIFKVWLKCLISTPELEMSEWLVEMLSANMLELIRTLRLTTHDFKGLELEKTPLLLELLTRNEERWSAEMAKRHLNFL